MRAVENLGGTVHTLDRERLRVDGLLTNCQTGDRILYCEPMEKVLPRTLRIGKYMAVLLHKEQKTDSSQLTCNKCLQTGHVLRECPNEWVCTTCNNPGHKKAECPNFETVIANPKNIQSTSITLACMNLKIQQAKMKIHLNINKQTLKRWEPLTSLCLFYKISM
ncbi:Hypothetical predicted protein [Mytilus galloprovincialis]|uniref:CCHC-type domain-containing protein n=1 Tax=Mytilus galloprovincialis TaxID=29158 RepID=A0A8B6EYA3_MYTGA|nr:Hypothetical predicted protein [Mytilus galloprovincialis]